MNWLLASATMEKSAIKTDVIASEDAYFMATHVPFANLEILRGGSQLVEGGSLRLTEEEVYQQLIYNPDNVHRMIIVRGSNGTGKSHLIRWLCARYKNDKDQYDDSQEKIIFLRRLSNTIRGAIKQILDEDIVFDPDMRAKLEKFVSSSHSMDAENFKLNIYHQFIVALSSDTTDKTYSKGVRRDIAAFLSDPRVEQHMLRVGGPVDRCFNAITAPSDQVFKGESTFSEEDFNLPRDMKRAIKNSGSDEAENILGEISDDEYVSKLVKYLNSFTPKVIQGCADISSEGTKEVFLQLRRELKKQGKNLTIFIEDFTAFTGLDAELITVLAAEHGGENSDLCRVTSVIGITDQYYKQFRGNFTDRVQYQVFVNAGAYGSPEFLIEMTARYLNAIYCEPKKIEKWFANGAQAKELPHSGYSPEFPWDTASVEGKELTLYPFNKKSVLALYEALSEDGNTSRGYEKTPRMFLLYVIKEQMSRFFDGKSFNQWNFPSEACIACPILLKDAGHDSAIDGMTHLSEADRRRVKILLQFWGNGTATVGTDAIGTIHSSYFADIALSKFTGFGGAAPADDNDQGAASSSDKDAEEIVDEADKKRKKNLQDRISDINEWITSGTTLNYSADYRKWMREFLQESINWQSDGIPAYIASKRLNDPSAVYIECQKETTTKEKAIVVLERTKESKDLLTAIVYRYYAKSWGFKSGLYFQLRTISWLEKNRSQIVSAVTQGINYGPQNVVLEWCVAVEYLQAAFLGISIPHGDNLAIAQKLLINKSSNANKSPRTSGNQDWEGAIRYLNSQEATYADCHEIFQESLRTFMGTDVSDKQRAVGFFRSRELLDVISAYEQQGWHLATVDAGKQDTGVYKVVSYMNNLLGKIQAATTQEDNIGRSVIARLTNHLGEITEDNIAQLLTSISLMFNAFANNNRFVGDLLSVFNADVQVTAKKVVEDYKALLATIDEKDPVTKLALYANDPIASLLTFVENLDKVEKLATTTTASVQKEMAPLAGGKDITKIRQRGVDTLKHAMAEIKKLEVTDNAD